MSHVYSEHHCHRLPSFYVLTISLIVTVSFALIEALTGYFSHSLVLLGDAGHMAADSLSLIIAAIAAFFAAKPVTQKHTYGFKRLEVIVAGISSLALVCIVAFIAIEAVERLMTPQPVLGLPMIIVAAIGLAVNIIVALLLHRGVHTLNTQAALLHVLSDLFASIVALFAGAIIYFTGWTMIDPLLSLIVCGLILTGSFRLLSKVFRILMEAAPKKLELSKIGRAMAGLKYIKAVHDLHVWTITAESPILTAHVELDHLEHWPVVLFDIKALLHREFNIDHVTIQPESGEYPLNPNIS